MSIGTGLGYATVTFLAKAGAKVYLASRSESKARKAIEDIHREEPSLKQGSIGFLHLDLADIKNIVNAAATLKANEQKVDILSTFFGLIFFFCQELQQRGLIVF